MKVGNYEVSWFHHEYQPTKFHKGQPEVVDAVRETTKCIIKVGETQEISSEVRRFYKDSPNRRVAVKESFKRVVSKITSKEDRKILWEAFKARSPRCVNC